MKGEGPRTAFDSLVPRGDTGKPDTLRRKIDKLEKINQALMQRVERSMDQQANAFSLFQTAISLESQVRLRTDELKNTLARLEDSNSELVSARDAAERANRFKTRFFTAVGHDLLQPLHAAKLSLSALNGNDSDDDQTRLIARVDHALVSIEEILRTILDLSKLEEGYIRPDIQDVVLEDVFQPVVHDVGAIARTKGLELSYRPNKWIVRSDPLMLRRILQNLLANAVRYAGSGKVLLAARRRGRDVRIEVWDTGPGIEPAEKEKIFEEFQRGAASEAADISGFGLGLSIAQRMSDTLGHELDLCSRPGRGTCFQVYANYVGDHSHSATSKAPKVAQHAYGFEDAKILVIDNEEAVLDAMRTVLEKWSCDCRFLRSYAEIARLFRDEPYFKFQVVLADYHLDRGETGLKAIEQLRALCPISFKPVIVTADHSPETAELVAAANCQLLLKPVRPAQLRALLQHLLA